MPFHEHIKSESELGFPLDSCPAGEVSAPPVATTVSMDRSRVRRTLTRALREVESLAGTKLADEDERAVIGVLAGLHGVLRRMGTA